MARPTTIHVCSDCGHSTPRWHGQCPGCGAWNTLVEERAPGKSGAGARSARPAAGVARLADVSTAALPRLLTGIGEFDRVLGGGIVPGSLVLLGGSPGIGKSTLLLQAAAHFAKRHGVVLYASGEESEHQIKARGEIRSASCRERV